MYFSVQVQEEEKINSVFKSLKCGSLCVRTKWVLN